jgi:hypothetical protein
MWKVKSDNNCLIVENVTTARQLRVFYKKKMECWSFMLLFDGTMSHVQLSPKGRKATNLFCTTEPGLHNKPCQTRMDSAAECVTV